MEGHQATTNQQPKSDFEVPKIALFEDDNEFEVLTMEGDFGDTGNVKEVTQQWEDDWDDEEINEYFSLQLRKELEDNENFDKMEEIKLTQNQHFKLFSDSFGEANTPHKKMKLNIDLNKLPEQSDEIMGDPKSQQLPLTMLKILLPKYFVK